MSDKLTSRNTPKKALHDFCHYCVQSRLDSEVENCTGYIVYATGKPCPFYPYRLGKRPPIKILRQICRECMGGNLSFIRDCKTSLCAIHPYRFGKNPAIKGAGKDRMAQIRRPDTVFSTAKSPQNQFSGASPMSGEISSASALKSDKGGR